MGKGKIWSDAVSNRHVYILRTIIVVACAIISCVGADAVQAFIAFIGAFCCVPLALIYPVAFHIKLCKPALCITLINGAICLIGTVMFFVTSMQALAAFVSPT